MPTALVVEDSSDTIRLSRVLLTRCGPLVVVLPDGEGLPEVLTREGPSLVLPDIALPGEAPAA